MQQLNIRLPDELIALLDAKANATDKKRAQVAAEILSAALMGNLQSAPTALKTNQPSTPVSTPGLSRADMQELLAVVLTKIDNRADNLGELIAASTIEAKSETQRIGSKIRTWIASPDIAKREVQEAIAKRNAATNS